MSVLSWLVTAVGATCLAYAFARAGTFSNRTGGMGGYAEYAHGKSGNFMTNYTYFISLVIANVAIAVATVGYGANFFGADLGPWPTVIATIGVLWLASTLNFGGPRRTGNISSYTVWGVIVPVLGISIIGWFWFSPDLYAASWNPHRLRALPRHQRVDRRHPVGVPGPGVGLREHGRGRQPEEERADRGA